MPGGRWRPPAVTAWQRRYPERWTAELDALDATGWTYRAEVADGSVWVTIVYPFGEDSEANLRVRFSRAHPFFPPAVTDEQNELGLSRHRNPTTTRLCLIEPEDWRADMTIADLLHRQLPGVLAAGSPAGLGPSGNPDRPDRAADALEVRAPEPVHGAMKVLAPAVVVAAQDVPADSNTGHLLVRLMVAEPGATAIVEAVIGDGFTQRIDLGLHVGQVRCVGRWIRDPSFRPEDTAAELWKRICDRLPDPLDAGEEPGGYTYRPDLELVGVLVPDETHYNVVGESWVFMTRSRSGGSPLEWKYRPTQHLSRDLLYERTPIARELKDKSVVLVGVGAVGATIAQDLAQTGVGELLLADGDLVDVNTSPRQYAPLWAAGHPKALALSRFFAELAPYVRVSAVYGNLEELWCGAEGRSPKRPAHLRRRLAGADLVIDATADLCVARFLSAIRLEPGKPLLHASATSGGFGGVVAVLSSEACWACVEHARAAGMLSVPPADPRGWVTPTRCADVTYTASIPDLAQIGHHASNVAIGLLAGQPLAGTYFTASLRDDDGQMKPISWTVDTLARHADCGHHTVRDKRDPAEKSKTLTS